MIRRPSSGFEQELIDVLVVDKDFAGTYAELAMNGNADEHAVEEEQPAEQDSPGPVRGFPGLTVAAASPQTAAGSDFSIFVLVQNPFDVPISVHQVQTHIPVELIDVNQLSVRGAKFVEELHKDSATNGVGRLWKRVWGRRRLRREHLGAATAVGTEFSPDLAKDLFRSVVAINRDLNINNATAFFSAISVVLPKGATSDQLDAVMRRIVDYQRGVLPVTLQPGDSVVR